MKNKLISDLTSQTKAGRGMAGAPGAAVTQERPEQNHYGTLYNHEHNLSTTTSTSCTKVHKTNTTTIVYKSAKPAHFIHLHIPEESHQHHGVQVYKSPTHSKGVFF